MTDHLRAFAEHVVSLDGFTAQAIEARRTSSLDDLIARARTALAKSPADKPTVSAVTNMCPEHTSRKAWQCPDCESTVGDPNPGIAKVREALREVRS